MKLEIARAWFLVAGWAVTTAAVAAWEEPRPVVFSKAGQCAVPHTVKAQQNKAEPDQDLLLFLFGMRQGLRPFG
ncbi:hypothetical protein [Pseudomonas putida]|uniref:hypothetical protein n=1 Tax=Pseudomonas putida TaxID=303 RepID=UPI0018D8D4A9|nr:hypothetical protein [Pseudomonas putida]MBH3409440.1 hypothetical protein [Pseudomonas putida]